MKTPVKKSPARETMRMEKKETPRMEKREKEGMEKHSKKCKMCGK
jgi:hypothetical protein